jgi:hypothetical protein
VHDVAVVVAEVAEQARVEVLERGELAERQRQSAVGILVAVRQEARLGEHGARPLLQVLLDLLGQADRVGVVDVDRRAGAEESITRTTRSELLVGLFLVVGQHAEQVELAVLVLDDHAQLDVVDRRALRLGPVVLVAVGRSLLALPAAPAAAAPAPVGSCAAPAPEAAAAAGRFTRRLRVRLEAVVDLLERRLDRQVHRA